MTSKQRMPKLAADEVILLVDTYFKLKDVKKTKDKMALLKELSDSMRKLPFYPEYRELPEFRSVAGMDMCINNVGSIDPDNPSNFGRGSNLQHIIFNRYLTHQNVLRQLANTVKAVAEIKFNIDCSYAQSDMGMLAPSYHAHLEQQDQTVRAVKRELLCQKQSVCRVCQTDLDAKYIDGCELLEIHIDRPFYLNTPANKITPSNLIALCPACHKLAHKNAQTFETQNLKKYIKERR